MATGRWLTVAAAGAMLTGAVLAGSAGLAMADPGRPVVGNPVASVSASASTSASASASASASSSASASPSESTSASAVPSASSAAPVPSGGVATGGGSTSAVPITLAAGLVLLVAGTTTAGTVLWRRRTDAG